MSIRYVARIARVAGEGFCYVLKEFSGQAITNSRFRDNTQAALFARLFRAREMLQLQALIAKGNMFAPDSSNPEHWLRENVDEWGIEEIEVDEEMAKLMAEAEHEVLMKKLYCEGEPA